MPNPIALSDACPRCDRPLRADAMCAVCGVLDLGVVAVEGAPEVVATEYRRPSSAYRDRGSAAIVYTLQRRTAARLVDGVLQLGAITLVFETWDELVEDVHDEDGRRTWILAATRGGDAWHVLHVAQRADFVRIAAHAAHAVGRTVRRATLPPLASLLAPRRVRCGACGGVVELAPGFAGGHARCEHCRKVSPFDSPDPGDTFDALPPALGRPPEFLRPFLATACVAAALGAALETTESTTVVGLQMFLVVGSLFFWPSGVDRVAPIRSAWAGRWPWALIAAAIFAASIVASSAESIYGGQVALPAVGAALLVWRALMPRGRIGAGGAGAPVRRVSIGQSAIADPEVAAQFPTTPVASVVLERARGAPQTFAWSFEAVEMHRLARLAAAVLRGRRPTARTWSELEDEVYAEGWDIAEAGPPRDDEPRRGSDGDGGLDEASAPDDEAVRSEARRQR